MMDPKRTAPLWTVLAVFAVLAAAGCGSSSPGVKNARTALAENDYDGALSGVERALEQDSTDTEAYLLKANILRERADTSLAPDEYTSLHRRAWEAEERALEFDADLQASVQRRRSQVYEREWERGTLAYNQANKSERPALYRRAIAAFGAAGIAQADSARPLLNEAFARLQVDEKEDVIPVLEAYVERAAPPSPTAYKLLGQLYLGQKNRRAADLLDRATRSYPADQELQALRLNAYNRAGEADRALDAYRKQIKDHPESAAYRYNYGALLLEAERYADAIVQLDSAVALRPSHVGSQYNLGAAYVNAALARDDSIAALEAQAPAAPADTTARRIDRLARKRTHLLRKAIPPLERARKMSAAEGRLRQDACRALMVAYVQTGRPNRAAQVESCTGLTVPER
jgi:Tfp pilus assembly protein PilF